MNRSFWPVSSDQSDVNIDVLFLTSLTFHEKTHVPVTLISFVQELATHYVFFFFAWSQPRTTFCLNLLTKVCFMNGQRKSMSKKSYKRKSLNDQSEYNLYKKFPISKMELNQLFLLSYSTTALTFDNPLILYVYLLRRIKIFYSFWL